MASSSHHQKQLSLTPRDTHSRDTDHSRGCCITHEMKTSISIEDSKKKETITTETKHKLRPITKGNHIALEQEVVNQEKKTVTDKQKLGVREEKHEVREKKVLNCITVEKGKHEVREKKILNCITVDKGKHEVREKKILNCITVDKGKHEVREKKILNSTKVEKEKKRIPHKHGSGDTLEVSFKTKFLYHDLSVIESIAKLKFQNFSAGVHVRR